MISENAKRYENVVIRNDKEIGINTFGLDYLVSLEQENERLNKELDKFRPFTSAYEMKKEIERLNNIINELEKWLEEQIKICQAHDNELGVNVCNTFKDKLKELKGDSNE